MQVSHGSSFAATIFEAIFFVFGSDVVADAPKWDEVRDVLIPWGASGMDVSLTPVASRIAFADCRRKANLRSFTGAQQTEAKGNSALRGLNENQWSEELSARLAASLI
jgi:hypothetical protein